MKESVMAEQRKLSVTKLITSKLTTSKPTTSKLITRELILSRFVQEIIKNTIPKTIQKSMPSWAILGLTAWVGAVGLASIAPRAVEAVQLSSGKVYFDYPPRLVEATTTKTQTFVRNPTYYFTLDLPQQAGEPLGQVAIQQQNGSSQTRQIRFRTERSVAFTGTRTERGESLNLAATEFDPETQTLTLMFDPPIPPGTTVTVGLRPERNPRLGGTYLFGVTAYPVGTSSHGQFLGFGQFNFFEETETSF